MEECIKLNILVHNLCVFPKHDVYTQWKEHFMENWELYYMVKRKLDNTEF